MCSAACVKQGNVAKHRVHVASPPLKHLCLSDCNAVLADNPMQQQLPLHDHAGAIYSLMYGQSAGCYSQHVFDKLLMTSMTHPGSHGT
jgi:hypothetical protein